MMPSAPSRPPASSLGPDRVATRADTRRVVAGRYRIQGEIAKGGMGMVYRAFDESRGVEVALKQLLPDSAQTPRLVALFEREYQTLANLSHPRIIRVYEFGISDVGPYYTMELLAGGEDLQTLSPLGYERACLYLRDVATSLALLHARGLVHRDVTPRNVLTTSDGHVKLLDFGALASFGITEEVLGTAPFIPPEVMRHEPLDQRSDLFSLGALAYYISTGQNAFPARRFEDLIELWRSRPLPPSKLVPEIPPQFDQLVLSLLSDDPRARPAGAAEVIDRLNAIAHLPPEPAADAYALAKAYLTNVRLVGRAGPLASLKQTFEAASSGEPRSALVVAEGGLGRSRLLAEAALDAQLAGGIVLRAEASDANPFATAQILASALLDVLPVEAREAAHTDLTVLAGLGPEFAMRLGAEAQARVPFAAGQWGDQVFEALRRWFSRVAERASLVLCVDNLDRADEASIALLSAFRREEAPLKLVVLATLSTDSSSSASSALKNFQQSSRVIALEPLAATDTAELLHTVFGDAPNLMRSSEWIHGLTAGRPLHIIELVDTLLISGAVRFVDGTWLLPAERPDLSLSHGLSQALAARLSLLSVGARTLAEALCLVQGGISFELCAGLAKRHSENAYVLLDELVHHRVLVVDAKNCRFANDAVREALASGMSLEDRKARHLALGELMLSSTYRDAFTKLMAGRHLMDGGHLSRGAEVVSETASQHTYELRDSIHLAAPVIARAFDVFEAEGRSPYETFPLLMGLADASFYADWRWAERYGQKAVDTTEDLLGVRVARRLSRFMGLRLAILVALIVSSIRFTIARPRAANYTLEDLFSLSVGGLTALVGSAAAVLDRDAAERGTRALNTLAWLGARSALDGAHEFCRALIMMLEENAAAASVKLQSLIKRFEDDKNYKELPADARKLWLGGVRYALGVYQTMQGNDEVLRTATALEQSGFALHRMFAQQLRLAYHMNRGELDLAEAFRKDVDLHAVHVGSAWQAEIWESASSVLMFMRSGDVVNSKRVAELFADMSRRMPALLQTAQSARAAVHLARAEFGLARDLYLELLANREPRSFAGWLMFRGALATAYNGLKEHERARALCQETAGFMVPADAHHPYFSIWVHLEWALAEAALGDTTQAAARLDELLVAGAPGDNPFLGGCLHHARARVAFAAADEVQFDRHLAETRRCFLSTRNAALSALCEQLTLLGLNAPWTRPSVRAAAMSGMVERMSTCTGERERAEIALEAILKLTKATSGMLFRVRDTELEVAARTGVEEPSIDLVDRVRTMLSDFDDEGVTGTYDTELGDDAGDGDTLSGYHLLRLSLSDGGRYTVLGAVALADGPDLELLSIVELDQIARGLTRDLGSHTAAERPGARN